MNLNGSLALRLIFFLFSSFSFFSFGFSWLASSALASAGLASAGLASLALASAGLASAALASAGLAAAAAGLAAASPAGLDSSGSRCSSASSGSGFGWFWLGQWHIFYIKVKCRFVLAQSQFLQIVDKSLTRVFGQLKIICIDNAKCGADLSAKSAKHTKTMVDSKVD